MNETKIRLSQPELELMCNAEIILTKNRILQKVKMLLENLQQQMTGYINKEELTGRAVWKVPPKISKGENYLGLPYLILDYPRQFSEGNIVAIRSMFWWGHFFSSTLHLSGEYKSQWATNAKNHYNLLCQKEFYVGINEDPWQHHFDTDNYILIDTLSKEAFINRCHKAVHIKIAAKWPLIEWHFAASNLWQSWKLLLQTVFNYPGGETNPSPDSPTACFDL